MFPTKAVWVWQRATEPQRVELVKHYFADSGMFEDIDRIERRSDAGTGRPGLRRNRNPAALIDCSR